MAREAEGEGSALQPVRLVLLLIDGPRRGENDFLDFPSVDAAVAYGRELYGQSRFQLDGIEDASGRSLIAYDHLNDLCRAQGAMPQRKYG
jgi:hypothetical protein